MLTENLQLKSSELCFILQEFLGHQAQEAASQVILKGTSLVVQWFKTLYFQCKGQGFNSWLRN